MITVVGFCVMLALFTTKRAKGASERAGKGWKEEGERGPAERVEVERELLSLFSISLSQKK